MTMMALFAAMLFALGVVGVAYGLAERSRRRQDTLAELIESELADPSGRPEHLAELVERAGAMADRVLSHTTFTGRIQVMLTRAGWALRPGEFGAVLAAWGAGGLLLVWFLTGSVLPGISAAVFAPALVIVWIRRKGSKRVRKIEEQLPTVLQLLAGSLDSGASLLHAMEIVVEEGDPPISTEFARVVAETQVGRPTLEALEAMAERVGSQDLDWTVEAMRIQHTTGGKLADTLRVLAGFMRARLEVRGEVRALSAEARLSAKVLTGLPIAVAAFLFFFRGAYMAPLYSTGMGKAMIAMAVLGMALGTLWMRRIVRVEV